jgi:hypothetical protein
MTKRKQAAATSGPESSEDSASGASRSRVTRAKPARPEAAPKEDQGAPEVLLAAIPEGPENGAEDSPEEEEEPEGVQAMDDEESAEQIARRVEDEVEAVEEELRQEHIRQNQAERQQQEAEYRRRATEVLLKQDRLRDELNVLRRELPQGENSMVGTLLAAAHPLRRGVTSRKFTRTNYSLKMFFKILFRR